MELDHKIVTEALRRTPVPSPRRGFVDDVLSKAVAESSNAAPERARTTRESFAALARWETWMGVALGAIVTSVVMMLVMRPEVPTASHAGITLAMNESRNIEVLIDSERTLEDATIRVATVGSVELDGLDDAREVQWQTRLERGRNVLSLPVVARSTGAAQLIAVIEHDGRSRRVAVDLVVKRALRAEAV